MSIESAGAYLNLISNFIKICSAVVPAVAWLMRLSGFLPARPRSQPEFNVVPVLGFGCLGSVLGLFVTIVFSVGAVFYIGLKFFEANAYGTVDFGLPVLRLPKLDLIFGCSGIGLTLIAFGARNVAKALGFLTGALLGMTFGLLFLLTIAISH